MKTLPNGECVYESGEEILAELHRQHEIVEKLMVGGDISPAVLGSLAKLHIRQELVIDSIKYLTEEAKQHLEELRRLVLENMPPELRAIMGGLDRGPESSDKPFTSEPPIATDDPKLQEVFFSKQAPEDDNPGR